MREPDAGYSRQESVRRLGQQSRRRRSFAGWTACWALLLACAGTPEIEPFPATIARPGAGEAVVVDTAILVFDASGSIDRELEFPPQKALLSSFVAGMPAGTYAAGLIVIGARDQDQLPLASFDRWHLRERVERAPFGGRGTPLAEIFARLREPLAGREGRIALFLFSDGVPTRNDRPVGPEETLAAATRLVASQAGSLCLHATQVGNEAGGRDLLSRLAELSPCGSFHTLAEISSAQTLHSFQRQAFLGPEPPPAAAAPRFVTDLDRDGIDDRFDRCPRTPVGARVDERGCWVIEDTVFETDSSVLRADRRTALEPVAEVLRLNPELRVRLDGHTDASGTPAYNLDLSERRARALAAFLQERGIAADRLESRGFGASRPIAGNDTPAGREKNRRVELSILER